MLQATDRPYNKPQESAAVRGEECLNFRNLIAPLRPSLRPQTTVSTKAESTNSNTPFHEVSNVSVLEPRIMTVAGQAESAFRSRRLVVKTRVQ